MSQKDVGPIPRECEREREREQGWRQVEMLGHHRLCSGRRRAGGLTGACVFRCVDIGGGMGVHLDGEALSGGTLARATDEALLVVVVAHRLEVLPARDRYFAPRANPCPDQLRLVLTLDED